MIIALTGTPGTGKTFVADKLGYKTIHLTEFIEKRKLGEEIEGELEVNIDEMVEALKDEVSLEEDTVIEGHLAHHFPADYCVVLRCKPDVLKERLSERDYSEEKVNENVESEAMDLILSEAVQVQEKVVEINTTEKSAEETAEELKRKIDSEKEEVGAVNWSEFL